MITFDPIPEIKPMAIDIRKVLLKSLNVLYDELDQKEETKVESSM